MLWSGLGIAVGVGGTTVGVDVARIRVAVGGAGVAVGGIADGVGGTGVGVEVGGIAVGVGGMGVNVGGIEVAVGGTAVGVGIGAAHATNTTMQSANAQTQNSFVFIFSSLNWKVDVGCLMLDLGNWKLGFTISHRPPEKSKPDLRFREPGSATA